jgi:hypothetical protein
MTHLEQLKKYNDQLEEIAVFIKSNKIDLNKTDLMEVVRRWYIQNVKFGQYYKDNQFELLQVLKKLAKC